MTTPTPVPKLFSSAKVGNCSLKHRVVMAPLTRFRANRAHVHGDLAVEYYSQRATAPGTLLITEATFMSQKAGGYDNVPGIWNDDQVAAWKRVTDAVHAKGSFIFVQLWALGRTADPNQLKSEDPNLPYVAPSPIPLSGKPYTPREMTVEEIKGYMKDYAIAARNAVRAGFDGVEIHGANGYLGDQFLQDVTNKRADEYGGSIENRARYLLEALETIVNEIGQEKTGIRLSPWSTFQEMRMENPKPTFAYLVSEMAKRWSNLAYIHVVEPRVQGNDDCEPGEGESNDFLREIWAPRPLISAGGYKRDLAIQTADEKGDVIAFGRFFISNPDLPKRLQKNIPLIIADRSKYYIPESPLGYIDYPFAEDEEK